MPVPTQTAADVASDYATLEFIIQALANRLCTAQLVAVKACTNSGTLAKWGTVDAVPLVNMVNGDGTNTPHGTLYKLPYLRIQGGTNAVIIDPSPGDIGLAVFAMRDISSVKADPVSAVANATGTAGTPPSSARVYDFADGVYLGGVLNVVPTQTMRFGADGITITSPTKVTVEAPEIDLTAATKVVMTAPEIDLTAATQVTITAPLINLDGEVVTTTDVTVGAGLAVTGNAVGHGGATFTNDVVAAGKSVSTHGHLPGSYVAASIPVTGNAGTPT